MIALHDEALFVRIDPAHGGEALDLVDLASGRQLLAHTPWSSELPQGGDLDEDAWTAAYRGGWQFAFPSTGNPSVVDGDAHGFHGRASNDPWDVLAAAPTSATLAWAGHGLRAQRTWTLDGGALRVETTLTGVAERPAPYVMLEHLAVGVELLDPVAELTLPAAPAFELDETFTGAEPPAGATAWPEVRLLDGGAERGDRLTLSEPRSRLTALHALPAGRAAVRNARTGQGLALAWDRAAFPHMWTWHEARTLGGQWRDATELLIIEPSTVPHHAGLAAAVASGHARRLARGETATAAVVVRPFTAAAPVRAIGDDARVETR